MRTLIKIEIIDGLSHQADQAEPSSIKGQARTNQPGEGFRHYPAK